MGIEIRFGTDRLDWGAVCRIFERAPLGTRDPEKLRRSAENSYVVCSAWDGEVVVGYGSAISDGEYHSAIYDVVVLPEYQGRGVGRAIMQALLGRLPRGSVLIYVVPGREGFYRKLGFANLATGMGIFPDPDKARSGGYLV
jgi:ribosomal protein S18 acetylase RimI-like enzyme